MIKPDPSSALRWSWMPLAVLVLSLVNWVPYVYSRTSSVTTENIQPKVRHWLDTFHLASQEVTGGTDAYFAYIVTLANGGHVRVERTKDFDQYIAFTSSIMTDKSAKALFDSLTATERAKLRGEIVLDLSRARIASFVDENLLAVGMSTRLPITPTLSEADFIGRIDEMDFAMAGVLATVVTRLPTPPAASPAK